MAKKTDLSPAELEIMEILWRKGHASVKDVQAELGEERKLNRTTVAMQLSRMKEKGYVEAREKNFAYEFHPLVDREDLAQKKLDDVVVRLLGGNVAPLAAYIAKNRKLTPEQMKCMEEIMESSRKEK